MGVAAARVTLDEILAREAAHREVLACALGITVKELI